MKPTHPIRLGLALNKQAFELAKKAAFDDAIAELDIKVQGDQ